MEPNPYTPSGRPRVFVGREEERSRLRDRLARVVAYGEMMGPLTVVTGPRGLGKTSLLRDVADQAVEDGFVVAWVSGVKHQPFLGDVVHQVTGALRRAEVVDDRERSGRRVQEVGLEVSAGIAKVSAKLGADRAHAEPTGALLGPVEDFFRTSCALVRDRGGAGVLLVIDELHAPLLSRAGPERPYDPAPAASVDAGVLLNVVQHMDADRSAFAVGVLGAGLPPTKALLSQAATFGERSHEMVLAALDQATAEAVLVEPARRVGVEWAADALAAAVAQADGYPQTLHVIGSATWEAARPDRGHVIDLADVEGGRAAAAADLASLFETRWALASEAERAFLRAMAKHAESSVRRGAIAAELGVDTDALGMVRRSLLNKGVVEAPARGRLRFTIPGFGEFVRAQDDG